MASKSERRRGALPKFKRGDAAKIRAAYGKPRGRGKASSKGMTLKTLADQWGASIATIRAVVLQIGAYAPQPKIA